MCCLSWKGRELTNLGIAVLDQANSVVVSNEREGGDCRVSQGEFALGEGRGTESYGAGVQVSSLFQWENSLTEVCRRRALVEENVRAKVGNLAMDWSVQKVSLLVLRLSRTLADFLHSIHQSWKAFLASGSSNTARNGFSRTSSGVCETLGGQGKLTELWLDRERSSEASKSPIELWLHGMGYDIDSGIVTDLGVSQGPTAR